MRECSEVHANQHVRQAKRVSVRSGGAGHAHSGVVRSEILSAKNAFGVGEASPDRAVKSFKPLNSKIAKLGTQVRKEAP